MTEPQDMTDKELDAAVAEEVMGWRRVESEPIHGEFRIGPHETVTVPLVMDGQTWPNMYATFAPTQPSGDTFEVLEAMRERARAENPTEPFYSLVWERFASYFDPHIAGRDDPYDDDVAIAIYQRMTPRAIAEAALHAVRAEKKG